MAIVKKGSAHWEGSVKEGQGTVSTETGALKEHPYGFKARFEGGKGTNPEEIIGAAHAACFSMAFSMMLGNEGFPPDTIDTTAAVSLEKEGEGFSITKIHLDTQVVASGIDQATFDRIAQNAKENCPVSKLLNAEITMDAKLATT